MMKLLTRLACSLTTWMDSRCVRSCARRQLTKRSMDLACKLRLKASAIFTLGPGCLQWKKAERKAAVHSRRKVPPHHTGTAAVDEVPSPPRPATPGATALGLPDLHVQELLDDLPPDLPLRLRAMLRKLGCQHPSLLRDIVWCAAASVKVRFWQACGELERVDEPSDRTRENIQELWSLLGLQDRLDLVNAHTLGDGRREQYFLRIAEEDRQTRAKLA
mmetsp:Transcript_134475/g.374787  ORF Transcript_134475/g.374787 Transcript_134475/m.374787 type:complete len:218 (-) Transcript_134475:397-1050(-)